MGFRMKNFNIMGVSLKNLIFRWGRGGGVGSRKTNIGGVASKGGGLGESPDLRKRAWQKKRGWCF